MTAKVFTILNSGTHYKEFRATHLLMSSINEFARQFDDDVLIINGVMSSPRTEHELHTALSRYKPKKIIMTAWVEPHWYSNQRQLYNHIKDYPHHLFGYYRGVANSTWFEFYAIVTETLFADYSDSELLPHFPSKTFINHNRSPRPHRESLYHLLAQCNLLEHGYVSYINQRIPGEELAKLPELYPVKKHGDSEPLFDVPNDPFTLGDLKLWRDSVVYVVSDGWWAPDGIFAGGAMITEKYYKPIIGLRPFLINGNRDSFLCLKEQGYDMFEDVFGITTRDLESRETIQEMIVRELSKITKMNLNTRQQWYENLLPRLQANKQLFYNRVKYYKQLQQDFRF